MVNSLLSDELSLSKQKAEQWKEIPGYEHLYEASTHGRIRTVEGKVTSSARYKRRVWKQRILKTKFSTSRHGRKDERVSLWKDGKGTTWLVARLVAMTWCAGYQRGLTVNHINGNTLDNRATNLEWCTREENIREAFRSGLYDSINKKVTLVDTDSWVSILFESQSKANLFLGRKPGYINNCIRHNRMAISTDGTEYIIC